MSTNLSVSPPRIAASVPRGLQWIKYVFWGGAIGLAGGLFMTFILAMFDGMARGLTPGSCVVYGCALTLMLSHPAGLGGMLVGGGLGAATGGALYLYHKSEK